ncbi:MAG: hypothetical protein SWH54_06195 [Thermodesulfobacteriota bacterium]|nr:hypothetical protein [Thermodesulfobacteriota bacterium]
MNQEDNKIRLPFIIIDDPIAGRGAYLIVEGLWILYIIIIAATLILFIKYNIKHDMDIFLMIMLPFFLLSIIGIIIYSLILLIKNYFYEVILVKKNRIMLCSKISKRERAFNIEKTENILCEIEHGNHATVYLVENNDSHILIEKFSTIYGINKIKIFIKELSNLTKIPYSIKNL